MKLIKGISILSAAVLLAACGSDDDDDNDPAPTYNFQSKLIDDASSVSYSGQVARNTMINELKSLIGSDQLAVTTGGASVEDTINTKLGLIYEEGTRSVKTGNDDLTNKDAYTLAATATEVNLSGKGEVTFSAPDYTTISSDKNLKGKIAGMDNDLARGEFIGWTFADGVAESDKADALVQSWFDAVAANGEAGSDKPYVSATGLDYKQLTQKFLLGAVAFSQASNDYLKADKGLKKQNSDHPEKDGVKQTDKPYTDLEHQWDEGFGYFGAARDYNNYTDAQLKKQKYNDTNEDGVIDLNSEYTFAMAQYANKRDDSAIGSDYSQSIMDNFIKGRQLIQDNFGTDPVVGEGYHAELAEIAKEIIMDWEEIFAANVIHYINATLEDMAAIDGDTLGDLPKHWGEMKGFALALQFNQPATSAITTAELKQLHGYLEEAPKLTNDADYRIALANARDLLKETFEFEGDVTQW